MQPLDRKKLFKKSLNMNDHRRRREENRVQIRKTKKEDQLMKRRQQYGETIGFSNTMEEDHQQQEQQKTNYKYTKEDIPRLMDILSLSCQSDEEILGAVKGFRKMLSVEHDPPVDDVLQQGVLPYLVTYISRSDNPMLTFEAAWALTNIASTNRTRDVVDAGAVPLLVLLLRHNRPELREQAAWCLGNIAGDCYELRNYVLSCGAMEGLILNLNEPETTSLLNNVTWAVSNLCRGKPSPSLEHVIRAIQPLADLLSKDVTRDVIVDAVWALSYLADGDNERIQKVVETNVTPRLIEFLDGNSSPSLTTPAVRCLGNFVTGEDTQTQQVIDNGVLHYVMGLLEHPSKNIRKETCWLLSNIAAGTVEQIDYLFREPHLLSKVITLACDSRWEIRREAIWVISNIFTTGSVQQIKSLVEINGLLAISGALTVKDSKVIAIALEAVEQALTVGESENLDYITLWEELQGIDRIEELQEHPAEEIYQKSVNILETFFGIEEEECENLAPTTLTDGTYGFGIPSKQLFPPENDCRAPPQPLTFNFGGSTGHNRNNF